MKGIILAGGSATRLYPATKSLSKQLLTVYDKPMIYYPISVLMLSGIKEILIITNSVFLSLYQDLLNDGSHLGINIQYAIQDTPKGLADAFIIGEDFIGDSNVCLILGDNIFYGQGLVSILQNARSLQEGAKIFGYYVKDPERYGIAEISFPSCKVSSIEEKPQNPKSNYAITGLYFFDNSVIKKAKAVKPSKRGELEITSVLQAYLEENNLNIEVFGRGVAWLDTGTYDSLLEASNFIATIEKRQGLKIACLEEVAYNCKYIDAEMLLKLAELSPNSDYCKYLKNIYSHPSFSILNTQK
ncbi:glucose-1-phosphate thymidylyltransferase [Rickettsia sp. MEAM1 (Bemisia tabaci)]|uniref:glucose-1-phosphate thymidylyltransferase RfbA n=1 Tax=unclassified Rickettsia TaxID=114295 RepID=UPI00082D6E19|nr:MULTISPECIES: glucose-1-phosphate thymidylyltransferase RfbA [unclassified Rickettsia]ASX27530.1 glucose-1-phosphate thymidylyltransferase [Rickettsia sp. MEAM1 (Bemisia tabaci)]ODA36890.1 glucose-1-phosphate thymidylyltransferase [Rickettsia sp. wq]ODA38158.1 glucose-1-phosphate thymidylyltransferase [Rickettsia sp. wb]HJD67178.1 glucose-1-phosphate thymidylyltransferase RfbA [Rickettsia endosymbiont of Bembidion lapponicum]